MTKVIGILSAKGGVGKTTTAINIATALNEFGYSTLLIDTDLTSPNVGLFLGNQNHKSSLNQVLEDKSDIFNSIYVHDSGINVINSSLHPNLLQNFDYKKIDLNIKKLLNTYDYIIIDTSPGKYEEKLLNFSVMTDVVIVTTPDMVAVTDALRTVTVAKQNKKNIVGVVLTRVGNHDYEIRKENVEAILGNKILSLVPEDKNIPLSIKVNNPIIKTHPDSLSSIAYKKIASILLGSEYKILKKED